MEPGEISGHAYLLRVETHQGGNADAVRAFTETGVIPSRGARESLRTLKATFGGCLSRSSTRGPAHGAPRSETGLNRCAPRFRYASWIGSGHAENDLRARDAASRAARPARQL